MIKKINFNIFFLINIVFIYIILCFKAYSDNFVTLGNDEAKVKIKIFSSLTSLIAQIFIKILFRKLKRNISIMAWCN